MCLTKLKVAAALLLTVLIGTTADGLSQRVAAHTPPTQERKLDTAPAYPLSTQDLLTSPTR
jgi:hypothetical protein